MAQSTIDNASRNAGLDALNGVLNQGAGANPTYEFGDAGFATTYLTFTLDGTAAFNTSGTTNPGESELTGEPINTTGLATGTATNYQIKDKDGTVRRSGTLDSTIAVTFGASYNLTGNVVLPAS